MVGDAVVVFDAVGEDVVHVYGISFGGMVVQELVLWHVECVNVFVLGVTMFGGLCVIL